MLRCLVCGSSELDPEGYKCARCGGAIGLRSEACYVMEKTKKKLLDHADELSEFGIEIEQHETLRKTVGETVLVVSLVLRTVEAIRPGTLRDLVLFLREFLPEDEILRLRLDEPELILTYYRMDKEQSDARLFH